MITRYIKLDPLHPLEEKVLLAAEYLAEGKLVAFPTETVYGLGANAFNRSAVRRIFEVKGRPQDNPLIHHIYNINQLYELTSVVTKQAEELAKNFWPGPLTIVLPRKKSFNNIAATAGLDTVAVRMPDHFLALNLIEKAKVPIAAPSANLSGKPSPTCGLHVLRDLAGKIEMVLDGGYTRVGLESTVVDCTGSTPVILRPGGVTREDIEEKIGDVKIDSTVLEDGQHPASPGVKYLHYAPEGKVYLVHTHNKKRESVIQELDMTAEKFYKAGCRVVIIAFEDTINTLKNKPYRMFSLGSRESLQFAASKIYKLLRLCNRIKADHIIIEGCAREGMGLALMNRLEKSAGH